MPGLLTSWTQVPGSPRTDAIAPVALDERAGARSVFLSVFVDLATPIAYQPRTLALAAQMRDYVRSTPAAFGYVDLAYAGELHAIPYEGVPCTRATVRSGAYPARRPLGFVTRGRPRGETKRFLRWIRHSPHGAPRDRDALRAGHHSWSVGRTMISLMATRAGRVTMNSIVSAMSSDVRRSICLKRSRERCLDLLAHVIGQLGRHGARLDERDAQAAGGELLAQRLAERADAVLGEVVDARATAGAAAGDRADVDHVGDLARAVLRPP